MMTGTGVVELVNGIQTLTDFKSNIRLSAAFNTGQRTGDATIYLQVAQGVWQSFQIVDTNPHVVCSCQVFCVSRNARVPQARSRGAECSARLDPSRPYYKYAAPAGQGNRRLAIHDSIEIPVEGNEISPIMTYAFSVLF